MKVFGRSQSLMRLPIIRWVVFSRLFGELFFYSTVLVAFQHERGLSLTEMFLMESILAASFWLFDIPTSVLADRIGHRRLLIIGRLIGVAGIVLFAFSYGFWWFCVAEVLGGMAMACAAGSESTFVYDALPEKNRSERATEVFALLGSASSAGLFIGLFTGSFLGAIGPSIAVYASIVPSTLALVAMLRVPVVRRTPADPAEERPRARAMVGRALATLWRRPRLSLLSIFRSVTFVLTNAIFWYNQLYFEQVGIPVVLFGPLMAGVCGLQLLVMLRLAAVQRRIGAAKVLMISCVVPGICYAMLAWSTTAVSVVVLVAGVVTFSAWQRPVVETELNNNIADRSRATTLSSLALVGAAAAALVNPVVGWVGESGLTSVGLALGGALIVLGLLAPLLLRDDRAAAPANAGTAAG